MKRYIPTLLLSLLAGYLPTLPVQLRASTNIKLNLYIGKERKGSFPNVKFPSEEITTFQELKDFFQKQTNMGNLGQVLMDIKEKGEEDEDMKEVLLSSNLGGQISFQDQDELHIFYVPEKEYSKKSVRISKSLLQKIVKGRKKKAASNKNKGGSDSVSLLSKLPDMSRNMVISAVCVVVVVVGLSVTYVIFGRRKRRSKAAAVRTSLLSKDKIKSSKKFVKRFFS